MRDGSFAWLNTKVVAFVGVAILALGVGYAIHAPKDKVKVVTQTVTNTVEVPVVPPACSAALDSLFSVVKDYNQYAIDVLQAWKTYVLDHSAGMAQLNGATAPDVTQALAQYQSCKLGAK